MLNAVETTYHYDVEDSQTYGHRANRLMYSETRNAGNDLLERALNWPHLPDYGSASWTDYNGDAPTGDYTVTNCTGGSATVSDDTHYALGMAEVDYCEGKACTDEVSYTHTNHLGTTRARTDAASIPYERPVYTAFGERIDGDVSTRYGYVGKHGYETMDPLDWGSWNAQPLAFDFIHTGARWYDPSTGRFLQRDPIGIRGSSNTYVYVRGNPLSASDPDGREPLHLGDDDFAEQWERSQAYIPPPPIVIPVDPGYLRGPGLPIWDISDGIKGPRKGSPKPSGEPSGPGQGTKPPPGGVPAPGPGWFRRLLPSCVPLDFLPPVWTPSLDWLLPPDPRNPGSIIALDSRSDECQNRSLQVST